MTKNGNKCSYTRRLSGGGGSSTRRRSPRLMAKDLLEISGVSTPHGQSQLASPICTTEEDLTSLRVVKNIMGEVISSLEPASNNLTPKDKTSLVRQTNPQRAAQNAGTDFNRKIAGCVNSVMSGRRLTTGEGNHPSCSSTPRTVQLLEEERNKKRKLIAGETTPKDQSSPLVSPFDYMEDDPATLGRVRYTLTEARNPRDPPQISEVSTSNGHSQLASPIGALLVKNILGEGISPFEPASNNLTSKEKTHLVRQTQPQRAAQNARTVLGSKMAGCVNSVMSGRRLPTGEGNHPSCSGTPSTVQLLEEERNKKRKLIAAETTTNDQSSPLVSPIDNMEDDPATLQRVRYTHTEARNPSNPPQIAVETTPDDQPSALVSSIANMEEDPATLQLVSNTATEARIPRYPPQDGSPAPNDHSSLVLAPTDCEQLKSLLEKFVQMRGILEKDKNTLEFLETQIQHDAEARVDESTRVKPEPIVIDLEDGAPYIVRRSLESTLAKIISEHGDIAKDCFFTSTYLRSRVLEKVCRIYEYLEPSNIFKIDVSGMSKSCRDIKELQQAKLDIKYLEDRVVKMIDLTEELTKAFGFRQTIKEEEKKLELEVKERKAVLEGYKKELEIYEGRAATLKELIKEEEEELELLPEKRVTDLSSQCLGALDSWMKKFKPILSK